MTIPPRSETWPALPLEAWGETYATLHMWTQIVGKIRLAQCPWINHCWHVALYVTSRGLTTSPVPAGDRTFQIDFDFIGHQLIVQSSDGRSGRVALQAQSVASFYAKLMAEIGSATSICAWLSILCRTRWLTRSLSIRMKSTARTTENTPGGSGVSSYRLIESSKSFVPGLRVNAVPCIFSGVRRIWP